MSLQAFFDSMTDQIPHIHGRENDVEVVWSKQGWGFGSFRFYKDGDQWKCDSECMNKEFVKEILCMLVDQAEFTDFPDKK